MDKSIESHSQSLSTPKMRPTLTLANQFLQEHFQTICRCEAFPVCYYGRERERNCRHGQLCNTTQYMEEKGTVENSNARKMLLARTSLLEGQKDEDDRRRGKAS